MACLTDGGVALVEADGLDVVVEATGSPTVGVRFARQAFRHSCHGGVLDVEADAPVWPSRPSRPPRRQ